MKLWLGIVTVVVLVAHVELIRNLRVTTEFRDAGITTDIVPSDPEGLAEISYGTQDVCIGEEISQTDVIFTPVVSYDFELTENYTILLIDPDLPSGVSPGLRSALHWLVVNVPGTNVTNGTTIASYVPAISYPGSGCHRFILLVYAQTRQLNINDPILIRYGVNRFRFSVQTFVNQFGLGRLAAATYFITCSPAPRDYYYCKK